MSGVSIEQLQRAADAYTDDGYYRFQIQTAVDLALDSNELTESQVILAVFEAFATRRINGKDRK